MSDWRIITVFILTLAVSPTVPGLGASIDDFSIEQAGVSAKQEYVFDIRTGTEFWGNARDVWAIGDWRLPEACTECEISARVHDGLFTVTSGADCPGTGTVMWGSIIDWTSNVSDKTGIQIDVASVSGNAEVRIVLYSGINTTAAETRHNFITLGIDSPGIYTVPFSEFRWPIALHDLNAVALGAQLDAGEFIAFNAVLLVPEPVCSILVLHALFVSVGLWRRKRAR